MTVEILELLLSPLSLLPPPPPPPPSMTRGLPPPKPAASNPASSSALSSRANGPVPLTLKVSGRGLRSAARNSGNSASGTTFWDL